MAAPCSDDSTVHPICRSRASRVNCQSVIPLTRSNSGTSYSRRTSCTSAVPAPVIRTCFASLATCSLSGPPNASAARSSARNWRSVNENVPLTAVSGGTPASLMALDANRYWPLIVTAARSCNGRSNLSASRPSPAAVASSATWPIHSAIGVRATNVRNSLVGPAAVPSILSTECGSRTSGISARVAPTCAPSTRPAEAAMTRRAPSKRTSPAISVIAGQLPAYLSVASCAFAAKRNWPPFPDANGNCARSPTSVSFASFDVPLTSARRSQSRTAGPAAAGR